MKSPIRFTTTHEAREEIRAFGGDVAGALGEKQRIIKSIGWDAALRSEIVKHLVKIDRDIYEIILKGTGPSYRVLCFPTRQEGEHLIVLTSCLTKGMVLTERKLRRHVNRAALRRAEWLQQNEKLP